MIQARRTPMLAVLILGLMAVQSGTASAAHAQRPSNLSVWGSVGSPDRGKLTNTLLGVSIVSAADIWAVGEYNPGLPPTVTGRRTLTEHWDGTVWSIVPSPNSTFASVSASHLTGVHAVASHDVWAVGYGESFSSLKSETLILHWGGAKWITVPSPNPGGANAPDQLYGIGGVASNDLWAVGAVGYPQAALTLHWDGAAWNTVTNQCGAPLSGVTAVSASDVWAVGVSTSCHWNGSTWTAVSIARPGQDESDQLYAVAASSAKDVWAAGTRQIPSGESLRYAPLVEHWNGQAWTAMTAVPGVILNGVVALAAGDVYVVGTDQTYGVVGHWDGSVWTTVPSPRPGGQGGALQAVASLTPGTLWAVGYSYGHYPSTLVEQAPSMSQGTLTGATGAAGATVSWFGPIKGSTTADLTGHYAVAGLPAGVYSVIASYPPCPPDAATVPIAAGTLTRHDFRIQC